MRLGLEVVTGSLYDALERAQVAGRSHSAAALESTSSLAHSPHLTQLLRSLIDDTEAAERCANWSYLHPLGFHKLMLVNAAPLFDLRLHVWWPDSQPGVDHIHNHRFALASAIVRGGYNMQLFQADPDGAPMMEYREMISPDGGWNLTPVGPAGLRQLTSVNLGPGASYGLATSALHRVDVVPGSLCVTLVLRTTHAADLATRVFARPGQAVSRSIPAREMSRNSYRRQLAALVGELTS